MRMSRLPLMAAAAVLAGLTFAPTAQASTVPGTFTTIKAVAPISTQTLSKVVPVTRVGYVIPQLKAAGWTCTTDGVLHRYWAQERSYYYTCTK